MIHALASLIPSWLWHPLGVCVGDARTVAQCRSYNFYSGIGSDAQEFVFFLSVFALLWHHTCHVGTCLRPGRHPVEGTGFKTCRRHHPDINHSGRTTGQHVKAAFDAARNAPLNAGVMRDQRGRFAKSPQAQQRRSNG